MTKRLFALWLAAFLSSVAAGDISATLSTVPNIPHVYLERLSAQELNDIEKLVNAQAEYLDTAYQIGAIGKDEVDKIKESQNFLKKLINHETLPIQPAMPINAAMNPDELNKLYLASDKISASMGLKRLKDLQNNPKNKRENAEQLYEQGIIPLTEKIELQLNAAKLDRIISELEKGITEFEDIPSHGLPICFQSSAYLSRLPNSELILFKELADAELLQAQQLYQIGAIPEIDKTAAESAQKRVEAALNIKQNAQK